MSKRPAILLATALALLAPAPLTAGGQNRKQTGAFFKGPIKTLSIEIEPKLVEQLKRKPREYVEASLKDGDRVYRKVALKLKGSQGSFQPIDRRPSLTLNFDKLASGRYHGMKR